MADVTPEESLAAQKRLVALKKEELELTKKLTPEQKAQKKSAEEYNKILNKSVESILRANRARNKGEKISAALYNITSKLEEKEDAYNDILAEREKKHDEILKRVRDDIKLGKKQGTQIAHLIEDRKKEHDDYKKFISEKKKENSTELKALENISEVQKKYEQSSLFFIRNEKDYNDALEERLKAQEAIVDAMRDIEGLSDTAYKRARAEVRSTESIAKAREDIARESLGPGLEKEDYRKKLSKYAVPEKAAEAGKFYKQEKYDLTKEMGGKLKALRSAKGFGGHIEAAKGIGETIGKFKTLRETLGKTAAGAKGAAGMFSLLGTGMEELGKIGWVGLILAAVTMIAKAVNGADKIIKGLNKSFLKLYGPTVALKDVRDSMRNFSDAVMDMNRNLKYGINKEQIMGLFEAMSAGGMSLAGVGRRVSGGYNEVIEEAAKLSNDFGVELSEMGSMIGDQMMNLRSSMKEVSDSMEVMAYDANMAGIQSQKFYEAVSSATDSLGYYGNYLKSTSALIKTFSTAGAMGFKDATKEAQGFMGVFKGMDATKRMSFITVAGAEDVRQVLQERAKDFANQEDAATKEIKDMKEQLKLAEDKGDVETQAALKRSISAKTEEQQTKKRQKLDILARTKTADVMEMQAVLPYAEDKIIGLMQKAMDNMHIDPLQDNILELTTMIEKTSGIPKDIIENYVSTFRMINENGKEASDTITKALDKAKKGTKEGLQSVLSGYMKDIEKGKIIDYDKMSKDLNLLKAAGYDFGMSTEDFMDQFQKNAYLVSASVDASVEGNKMTQKKIEKASEAFLRKNPQFVRGQTEQAKRIKEIVQNTRTFEEMLGIGKESAEYLAAMKASDLLDGARVNEAIMSTAMSAGGILQWLLSGKKKVKSDEDLKKDKDWLAVIELQKRATLMQMKKDQKNAIFEKKKKKWEEAKNKFATTNNVEDKKLMDEAEKQMNEAKIPVDDMDKQITAMKDQIDKQTKAGGFGVKQQQALAKGEAAAMAELEERNKLIAQVAELETKTDKDSKKKLKEVQKKLKGIEKPSATPDKPNMVSRALQSPSMLAAGPAGALVAVQAAAIDKFAHIFHGAAGKQDYMPDRPEAVTENVETGDSRGLAGVEAAKKVKDFRALTKGFVNVSKGDMVIDYKSLAKGLGTGAGQFTNRILPDKGVASAGTTVTVPITLQIGSVNGDVDDLVKKMTPAIEQSFSRMFFDRQKRK